MDITTLPTLTDAQRQQARQRARQTLLAALDEPQIQDFERQQANHYGRTARLIVMLLTLVVMLAAFVISAIHVYSVGRDAYLLHGGDGLTAAIIGGAFVVIAEISVIILSMAPPVLDVTRREAAYMTVGALAAALVAVIGNVSATIPFTPSPFDWLHEWLVAVATDPVLFVLATFPPLLTVLVGMVYKSAALSGTRARHDAQAAYDAALAEYRHTVAHLEQHPDWRVTWGAALWDVWRHTWREYLADIDDDTKLAIILREMNAEDRLRAALNAGGMHEYGLQVRRVSASDGRSKKQVVLDYLAENPDAVSEDQTALAAMLTHAAGIEISQSTVSRAVQAFSVNGHGEGN